MIMSTLITTADLGRHDREVAVVDGAGLEERRELVEHGCARDRDVT